MDIFKIVEKIMKYLIGLAIIIGFFGLLYNLIANPVPMGNTELLNIAVGALIGSFITVVGFYYGSSQGSSDKNEALLVKNKKD